MELLDFHTHILPGMDDGAQDVPESLELLRISREQGVTDVCATSHFYAGEDDPEDFLRRRQRAYESLIEQSGDLPRIHLGAEVLYFPGMSQAKELKMLTLGRGPLLLVEPPMLPWTDYMLDEIEETGTNLRCVPVIAHVDRYLRVLEDPTVFDRLRGRKLLAQVNASFFLYPRTALMAMELLNARRIHFIGSDCHNAYDRLPNMGAAAERIIGAGLEKELKILVLSEKKALEVS